MSRSLVVLPDDSARPILDAINNASKSLRIKMFVFTDPSLLTAVTQAQKRGVSLAFPSVALATDNAAMIAAAAWPKFQAGDFAPLSLTADASLSLGAK